MIEAEGDEKIRISRNVTAVCESGKIIGIKVPKVPSKSA